MLLLLSTLLIAAPSEEPRGFTADVAPILVRKCLPCHNDRKAEGGLNLRTFELLQKGGSTFPGEAVVPGDPDASQLVLSVRPDAQPRMPFKLPPLSAPEIAILERWVREGAAYDGPAGAPLASLVDPLAGLPDVPLRAAVAPSVNALAFTPEGRLLAARGSEVLEFDPSAPDPKPLHTYSDHTGTIASLLLSRDGKTLIAAGGRAGQFGQITLWSRSEPGAPFHSVRGHADAILAAALAPDGRTLATASYDRLILLWNLEETRPTAPVRTLQEHTDAIYALAFSPDGRMLASAAGDRTIKLWDPANGDRLATLSDATAEQYAVAFAPDGRSVVAAGADRTLRAWALGSPEPALLRQQVAHKAPILGLAFAPVGESLLSWSEDRTLQRWSAADLSPRSAIADQSDWPLAVVFSTDGARLAVGLYDGSLAVLDAATGQPTAQLLRAPEPVALADPALRRTSDSAQPAPKPELFRPAMLNPLSPRGGLRGTTVRVALTGRGVDRALEVVSLDPHLVPTVVSGDRKPDRLELDLAIASDTPPGLYRLGVSTPLGTPAFQPFAVTAFPETAHAEPDDTAKPVPSLPATFTGALEAPGDRDEFLLDLAAGQTLVVETVARRLGSSLRPAIELVASDGRPVARVETTSTQPDPVLVATIPAAGRYTLRLADLEYGGSGNHFYRLDAGFRPIVTRAFPLGLEPGGRLALEVQGGNLDPGQAVTAVAPADTAPGTILTAAVPAPAPLPALTSPRVVVAAGPQATEAEPNDSPSSAPRLPTPGGISGRIETPGEIDHYGFHARKGERLILEIHADRLGTPLDGALEVLDSEGRPVPRAVLRPVATTNVAFRDHNASSRTIRLTVWNDLAVGDHVLVGRELMRIFELPRNPDDDAVFWGLGVSRISPGARVGLLETTPEHHPMGQAIEKVEIHPPGSTFPTGGPAPVTLPYRNDDGGPGFGRDPRLTFDPPADGDYVVRVSDTRGAGGPDQAYHLALRPPRPGFRVQASPENPALPPGGAAVVTVIVDRIDGFDGPVDVAVEGLPAHLHATPTRIETGAYAAELLLTADPEPAGSSTTGHSLQPWTITARARIETAPGRTEDRVETFDPGGSRSGRITLLPLPNVTVRASSDHLRIRPGERIQFTLSVERSDAFKGRVPIDVRNLPHGVRVENIGLNGVLITESQHEREVSLYAEPWVQAQDRTVFAVAKCEPAGTEHPSAPIILEVVPE